METVISELLQKIQELDIKDEAGILVAEGQGSKTEFEEYVAKEAV